MDGEIFKQAALVRVAWICYIYTPNVGTYIPKLRFWCLLDIYLPIFYNKRIKIIYLPIFYNKRIKIIKIYLIHMHSFFNHSITNRPGMYLLKQVYFVFVYCTCVYQHVSFWRYNDCCLLRWRSSLPLFQLVIVCTLFWHIQWFHYNSTA